MGSNTPGRGRGTLACALMVPLSLSGFWLVNTTGFPRHFAQSVLGPDRRPPHGSAPPYLEWDIATMLLMLAICGLASVYLVAQLVRQLRARTPK